MRTNLSTTLTVSGLMDSHRKLWSLADLLWKRRKTQEAKTMNAQDLNFGSYHNKDLDVIKSVWTSMCISMCITKSKHVLVWKLLLQICVPAWVCVSERVCMCVCVCERERKRGRERETHTHTHTQTDRETETEGGYFFFFTFFSFSYSLQHSMDVEHTGRRIKLRLCRLFSLLPVKSYLDVYYDQYCSLWECCVYWPGLFSSVNLC